MKPKIKIIRMSLSKTFPATHPMKGKPTDFVLKICRALNVSSAANYYQTFSVAAYPPKIHTLRANPALWKKRIDEVIAGRAVLVLYEWNGKPFGKDGSKNLFIFGTSAVKDFIDELMKTEKYADAIPVIDSGIGVQNMDWYEEMDYCTEITESATPYTYDESFPLGMPVDIKKLAKNDGLSLADFKAFFKGYDLSKPMCIIHLTSYRY